MAKTPMTAAELLSELANNSDFQRKARDAETVRAATEADLRREEFDLVNDLQRTGIVVTIDQIPGQEYSGPPRSISDLVNTRSSYVDAIPILVKHLRRDYSRSIISSIVRALTVPESRGIAFEDLVLLFGKTSDCESELKWLIGAAIAEAAADSDVSVVIELANNKSHGRGREFLPMGLVTAPKQFVLPILEGWKADPILAKNAVKAIKLLK